MDKTIDVVAAGHICLDITPVFPDGDARTIQEILQPGKLVNVGGAEISLGGPVSNTGLAVHKFGLSIAACAGVGDDPIGEVLLTQLEQYSPGSAIHQAAGETTSFTVVIAPPGIDRIFLHCPGRNDSFTLDDVDEATVAGARLFHLGYPPLMRSLYENEGQELERIFVMAKKLGATTSLDMSLPDPSSASGEAPWPDILERVLPHVDIFVPSVEEIFFMLEREAYLRLRNAHPHADLVDYVSATDFRRLADRGLELGCGICAIKTGRRGYYLRGGSDERLARFGSAACNHPGSWARRELWAPAYHVPKIASATGSGDSSIAGFLTAFLRDLSPGHCMRLACAAGHFNLHTLDTLSGLPDWPGLLQFIDTDAPIEDPLLDGETFAYDHGERVFRGELDAR